MLTRLPGGERIFVVAPLVPARAEVAARELRVRCEELVVEVPPAELPHERLAARSARGTFLDFER